MTGRSAQEVVDSYVAAWQEPDEASRRGLLELCWAEGGTYCDPGDRVEGRAALAAHIGDFHARQPGARIEAASGVDEHHGCLRFAWRMLGPDGSLVLQGLDFGEVDSTGNLHRIVGFFGPVPSTGRGAELPAAPGTGSGATPSPSA